MMRMKVTVNKRRRNEWKGHLLISRINPILTFIHVRNREKLSSQEIFSKCISGESVTKQPLIKSMRGVKKETLNLISCWVSKSSDDKLVSLL